MLCQRSPDRVCSHLTQTDMGASNSRYGPGKAPAIAVEHGQSPKIHRMLGNRGRNGIALGQQCCTAMMIDDALGIAGGT